MTKLKETGWNKSLFCGESQILYNPLPKFENDHLFFSTEKYVVLLDGVVFNKVELMAEKPVDDWGECFINLYETTMAPDCLRGSFRGLVCEKSTGNITAFTNHTGEKTIYYSVDKKFGVIIASHVNIINDLFCSNGKNGFSANIQAHYELLLTGSVLHGNTPYENIYRLTAGKKLLCVSGEVSIIWYHIFKNIPEYDCSLDECIEKADILMRQAMNRIFKKSEEYGYKAECDLSGGLDSRFATWVAHDLGFNNFLNICYCVSDNLDNKISRAIAKDIDNEYFFLPMDAYVMGDIDKKTLLVGGQVLYMLSTGALYALDRIDTSNIGMTCTGLIGEMQNAYWTEGKTHTEPKYTKNRKSSYYNLYIPDTYSNEYDNYEQMNLYEYSYSLFLLSALIRHENVEVFSPFLDADYMDYIFRIPLRWRKDYYFSQAYMCKKYPKAASYNWQGKRMPVDKHFNKEFYAPKVIDDLRNIIVKVINKGFRMFQINHQLFRKDDMNPIETWYRNNKEIRNYINDYYNNGIGYVTNEKLREDLTNMFQNSSLATDKIQVINVISVWKNYIR